MTERYSDYIGSSNLRRKSTTMVKRLLQSHSSNPHTSVDEPLIIAESDNELPDYVEQDVEWSEHVQYGDQSGQELEEGLMDTECTVDCESNETENVGASHDEMQQPSLTTDLMNWALEYGITLVALTALLSILRYHHPSLPKDAKTLLHTSRYYIIKQVAGGSYFYFGIVNALSRFFNNTWSKISDRHTLKLQLNFDGLPIHKSTGVQLWPILGLVQGFGITKPCLIALFGGKTKPNSLGEYLRDLVAEIKNVAAGFTFKGKTVFIKITSVMCDAPARAFIKAIKSHTGYAGCDKCSIHGLYVDGRMTFPDGKSPARTDESFRLGMDEEHHRGISPLTETDIGMVSKFPHDYMHLVCLGVVRKLLEFWAGSKGRLKCRLPSWKINQLSELLLSFKDHMPNEFGRKPRSLEERNRWKATEFRQFLLYTGPVALVDVLDPPVYNNFMLLYVAISILACPSRCLAYCDFARTLLVSFVEHFGQLYGREHLVYNVHGLVHLSDDVKEHGHCLDNISGFPFENYLGQIKKMSRSPQLPVAQVVRRMSELENAAYKVGTQNEAKLRKPHSEGPLPSDITSPVMQYKEASLPDFCVKVFTGDDCISYNGMVGVVRNIIVIDGDSYLVYNEFTHSSSFFDYPLNSCEIGVFLLTDLSQELKCIKMDETVTKYVLLPFRNAFVGMPLLHLA